MSEFRDLSECKSLSNRMFNQSMRGIYTTSGMIFQLKFIEMFMKYHHRPILSQIELDVMEDVKNEIINNWDRSTEIIQECVNSNLFLLELDGLITGKSIRQQMEERLTEKLYNEFQRDRYQNNTNGMDSMVGWYYVIQFDLSDKVMEIIDGMLDFNGERLSEYKFKKIYEKLEQELFDNIQDKELKRKYEDDINRYGNRRKISLDDSEFGYELVMMIMKELMDLDKKGKLFK
tara:strand:- start:147 stop:842 length:696 start_codon:yes stop_codon:yes gene_type:complete